MKEVKVNFVCEGWKRGGKRCAGADHMLKNLPTMTWMAAVMFDGFELLKTNRRVRRISAQCCGSRTVVEVTVDS